MTGINHKNMSKNNKHLLLKEIMTRKTVTRGDLCKKTSLSKMTITALVNEFIEKGIIRECGVASKNNGRRPTLLEVVPNSLLTLAISIDRDMLEVGIINLKGQILCVESVPFNFIRGNDAFLSSLYMICDRIVKTSYFEKVWGVGISSAGPLSIADGIILEPPDFNNVKNLEIVSAISKRYGLPTYLQNDMCLAALSEVYFGDTGSFDNFIYVGIASGIGGGVIIDKQLYTGSNGLAGVIGHSIVEMDGLQCECGQKGCLEKYSSTRATLKWAIQNGADKSLSWVELTKKAVDGDEICYEAIKRMTNYLEVAVTNMEIAYDTECFIIGGDLHFCRELITERIALNLNKRSKAWGFNKKVQVRPSTFVGNGSFVGTVALVMENNMN